MFFFFHSIKYSSLRKFQFIHPTVVYYEKKIYHICKSNKNYNNNILNWQLFKILYDLIEYQYIF